MKQLKRISAFFIVATLAFVTGCAPTPTREGTGEYVDDSVITTKVKAAIFNEPTLKSHEIKVETFKDRINEMLAVSTVSKDMRKGLMHALETMLFATDNYKGFRYLDQSEVPDGELPGIKYIDDIEQMEKTFPDETRVSYY